MLHIEINNKEQIINQIENVSNVMLDQNIKPFLRDIKLTEKNWTF